MAYDQEIEIRGAEERTSACPADRSLHHTRMRAKMVMNMKTAANDRAHEAPTPLPSPRTSAEVTVDIAGDDRSYEGVDPLGTAPVLAPRRSPTMRTALPLPSRCYGALFRQLAPTLTRARTG